MLLFRGLVWGVGVGGSLPLDLGGTFEAPPHLPIPLPSNPFALPQCLPWAKGKEEGCPLGKEGILTSTFLAIRTFDASLGEPGMSMPPVTKKSQKALREDGILQLLPCLPPLVSSTRGPLISGERKGRQKRSSACPLKKYLRSSHHPEDQPRGL